VLSSTDRTVGSGIDRLFDAMAGSYDVLEPWYEHLYGVLHDILRSTLAPRPGSPRNRALDAGCGTGLQAALLAGLGWEAHGVDLSAGLLRAARQRAERVALARADIETLPYAPESFDAVACCGSTLSFVDDPGRALRELGRVLRPGGRLLLECEHRWSLDLGWAALGSLAGDCLGYGWTPREAWRALTRPPGESVTAEYPCRTDDGGPARWRLRLFTRAELATLLEAAGLVPERWWGIHSVTNLIPSTVLHRERLPRPLGWLYRRLCAVDRALARTPAGRGAGNSLVVLARKQAPPPPRRQAVPPERAG
jgi:SAM-dependent methyltransferase